MPNFDITLQNQHNNIQNFNITSQNQTQSQISTYYPKMNIISKNMYNIPESIYIEHDNKYTFFKSKKILPKLHKHKNLS